MKTKLFLLHILEYYDVPIVFTAIDAVGCTYICLLVDDEGADTVYVAAAISDQRLLSYRLAKIDLRSIFENPEMGNWLIFNGVSSEISAKTIYELPPDYLPDAGYFMSTVLEANGNETIIEEVGSLHKPVIHLAIADDEDKNSISASDLSNILTLYQLFIEYASRKMAGQKRPPRFQDEYTLRAFNSSPGSFNIHLETGLQTDLFGRFFIEDVLERFDTISSFLYDRAKSQILYNAMTPDNGIIAEVRQIKGHAISSYTKLLKKVIDNDLRVTHKWVSPSTLKVHSCTFDKSKATTIFQFLTQEQELGTEIRTLEGYFTQVDVDKKTWRIVNNSDRRQYSGTADREVLQGVTVETQLYRIDCEEILEELIVSQKEKTSYRLITIITLN